MSDAQPSPSAEPDSAGDASSDLSHSARLLAEALNRLETGGESALDEFMEAQGAEAAELRVRLASLRDLGFVSGGRIGPYECEESLGRGGMGVVHAARDTRDGRRVALKLLPWRLSGSAALRERFRREVRAIAGLRHPALVGLLESGEHDGVPWYAMEFVEGETLDRRLQRLRARGAPLELSGADLGGAAGAAGSWPTAVAQALAQVADALAHAHAHGVLHRDVKPANLLLGRDGRLRLFDFGLARLADEPSLTATGDLAGTPAYASPEQLAGERDAVDERSDVWGLGCLLFELLTLRRPFQGDTPEALARAVQGHAPSPPHRINPRVPAALSAVTLAALEKVPSRRTPSAAALAQDLRRVLGGLQPQHRPRGALSRALQRAARRPAVAVAVGLAALLAVGVPLMLSASRDELATQAARAERAELRATRAARLLLGLAAAPDPDQRGADVSVREWLLSSGELLAREEAGDPAGVLALRCMIANSFLGLGEAHEAEAQLGPAVTAARAAMSSRRDTELQTELAVALNLLGVARARQGRHAEAEATLHEALALNRRLLGERSAAVATVLANLAVTAGLRGDHAAAVPLLRDVLARRRELHGEGKAVVGETLADLALALELSGQAEPGEVLALVREALALETRVLGESAPGVATTRGNLAALLARAEVASSPEGGTPPEALALAESALELARARFGPRHPETARLALLLALLLPPEPERGRSAELLGEALPVLAGQGAPGAARLAVAQALWEQLHAPE